MPTQNFQSIVSAQTVGTADVRRNLCRYSSSFQRDKPSSATQVSSQGWRQLSENRWASG
jgi:hypothetical protein